MRKDLTLTVDASGNIIVAGPVAPGSATTFVAKLDQNGNLLWHETLSHGDLFGASPAASWPPAAPDDDRDSVQPLLLDPSVDGLRPPGRQSRIARWFGTALAFAGLFAIGIVGGAAVQHGQASAPSQVTMARSGIETAVAPGVDMAADEMTQAIGAAVMGAASSDSSDDMASAAERAAAIESDPVSTAPVVEPISLDNVVELRAEVLALLQAGQLSEAVEVGHRFVAADRENAFSYLCLGAALQDLGRGREARANYDQCVRHATRGDVSECMALGGRR